MSEDIAKVEYKVRQIERYIVTRYEERSDGSCGSEMIGEYATHTTAESVGYAMCKAEHQRLGWRLDDERIKYPCFFPIIGDLPEDSVEVRMDAKMRA